ncbi:DMT family transporter [Neptuniibacter sp. CAU 1671]|uniref:DMT family transporter n=1 Tax=Neptuniibacter sp. CAU 1671 TaxID=3032593 RepID=UPI0023D997C5|nr:DMT family transporter [Neptuniibacter sp. CAU 1671]MDF2181075.1 DMT family transporter [Neptuniibacter sp. CAU 1671]
MAHLLLFLTVLFWSGNFILARAIHLDIPPITLAFSRWLLALLLILPWLLPRLIRQWSTIRQHAKSLCFFGIVGVAGFNTQVYLGLQNTTASNAVLLQSMVPILIVLISAVLLGEKGHPRQWLGILLSFMGVTVLISQGQMASLADLHFNPGDLWILGAVTVWAIYSIGLRWKPKDLDGFTFFGATVVIAVVFLLPFTLWELQDHPTANWPPSVWGSIAYMAVFPSILSYLFWNKGVELLGAAKSGLYIHLMPVLGISLSILLLDEKLYHFHLWGTLLIFSGLYLAVISSQSKSLRSGR